MIKMTLGFDEINAYKNKDGSWTVEGYSDKIKFILPIASIDFQLQSMIGSPMELTITINGTVERN